MVRSASKPASRDEGGGVGLYVHVPFCLRHCPYCNFAVTVHARPPEAEYLRALGDELAARAPAALAAQPQKGFRTIYVGGGTPSMLSEQGVHLLGEALRRYCPELPGTAGAPGAASRGGPLEFTVEFNPENATVEALQRWRDIGVNRVSLGVQSLDGETLRVLGREHDRGRVGDAIRAVGVVGFEHLSVDLIYGVPGLPQRDIFDEIDELASYDEVDHISAYELTWEEKTVFGARKQKGLMHPPSDDALAEQFIEIEARLQRHGFEHYEVSSYARGAGARAVHNAAYWDGTPYLGVGIGAHSFLPLAPERSGGAASDEPAWRRSANGRNLRLYMRGELETTDVEEISRREHAEELLMMACRRTEPLDLVVLGRRVGLELGALQATLERFASPGAGRAPFGTLHAGRFTPNVEGLLNSDFLAFELLKSLEQVAD